MREFYVIIERDEDGYYVARYLSYGRVTAREEHLMN